MAKQITESGLWTRKKPTQTKVGGGDGKGQIKKVQATKGGVKKNNGAPTKAEKDSKEQGRERHYRQRWLIATGENTVTWEGKRKRTWDKGRKRTTKVKSFSQKTYVEIYKNKKDVRGLGPEERISENSRKET